MILFLYDRLFCLHFVVIRKRLFLYFQLSYIYVFIRLFNIVLSLSYIFIYSFGCLGIVCGNLAALKRR